MLRKGLILLAISLTVTVAMQAQAPSGGGGGGGGTAGGNTGGGGGGNTGGGSRVGGAPGGNQPVQQTPQVQMERPIFLSGAVLLASGEPPIEPIMIKRTCGTQSFAEGYTDSKGRFSFQVGRNSSLAVMDASIGGGNATGAPGANGAFSNFGNSNDPSLGVDLSGCQLEASAPGYRGEPIPLGRRRSMDRSDVGTIVLTPLGGSQAAVVSATSLAAPKKAKSSFEKAIKELSKGAGSDPEKAMAELEKAVEEYPEYAAAWTVLGQVRSETGDADGAVAALEKALVADPRYIRPYEPLIRLTIGRQDWDRTEQLADFVLGVNPADTKMRWYKAVSNFEAGRLDNAITLIDEIHSDQESALQYPQTHHILGLIFAKRGQFGEAAAEYQRYLDLAPDSEVSTAIKRQIFEWKELGVI